MNISSVRSGRLLIGLLLTGSLAFPGLMQTQTLFATPDTAVDLSQYRTAHECLAAFKRIARESVFNGPWIDTIPYKLGEKNRPFPSEASDAIQTCMQKFTVAEVGTDELTNTWVQALVLAGRDTDANMLARRNIASAPADSHNSVYRQALFLLQAAYSAMRPIPVQALQALDLELLPLIDSDMVVNWKINNFQRWKSLYETIGDSASRLQTAQTFLNDVAKDSALFRRSPKVASSIMDALAIVHHDNLMDSLRSGPDAYLALIQSYWADASGIPGEVLPRAIGQQAPELVGDYLFSSRGMTHVTAAAHIQPLAKQALPKQNAVNLIVFIRGCREDKPSGNDKGHRITGGRTPCWEQYAILRRLAARYPNLEMTLVSRTIGYMGNMNPMIPLEEVTLLSKWWLDFHKLTANLVIKETLYFHLQNPDGRRIDETDINRANYAFGDLLDETMRLVDVVGILIDINGKVIHASQIDRATESEFHELLDVMMSRANQSPPSDNL